jgi:gamma-glutamyltranspeptidase/glutathione hydrolase
MRRIFSRSVLKLVLALTLGLSLESAALGQEPGILSAGDIHHPEIGRFGMVASQQILASQIGAEVLADGGNAVDAAVATAFALAVVLPRAGNLGGGGFMLVYLADEKRTIAIDYREMAPAAATRDMFLDADGNVDRNRILASLKSSGVPGTVAGLHHAHSQYGKLPWARLLDPAIRLARDGFVVTRFMSDGLKRSARRLARSTAAMKLFFKPNGEGYEAGERIRFPDLATTLSQIQKGGRGAFYRGPIARKITATMRRGNGLITNKDLRNYRVIERKVVTGTYRSFEIVSMPPPSSGGIHVIQMLNIIEHFQLSEMGAGSADAIHVIAEAMKLAYADRSKHLGDPDFYDVPVDWLLSKAYAKELAATIDLQKARPSSDIRPGTAPAPESPDTTQISVMDRFGNVVANTYTLNASYGSAIAVGGAGFLLNNEMDDFVAKPGVPNLFGMLGDKANAVAPGKRPLSSMTPTIMFKDGQPYLATGSPGGSRIITTVLQQIINVIDFKMGLADAAEYPRFHHQWLPDELRVEGGFSPDTLKALEARGHVIARKNAMGSLQTVQRRDGLFLGVSDSRRRTAGSVGLCQPRRARSC